MKRTVFYRGDSQSSFQVEKRNSRYGFEALFFTSNIQLARLYAIYNSEKERRWSGGFLYEHNILGWQKEIDYKNMVSHSAHFRSLIYQLKRECLSAVKINHVIDFPSEKYDYYEVSDILVVFDFKKIKDFNLLESNIKSNEARRY